MTRDLATTTDGRNLDPQLTRLEGEAAQLKVKHPDEAFPTRDRLFPHLPSIESELSQPTYYEQPVVKEPVWVWTIPAYFFVGGTAGALSLFGASLDLFGRDEPLAKRCHRLAFVGDVLSAGLLIYDLGRPLRFFNMLRVFRPSSPMSVGSWVLTGSGATNTLAALPLGALSKAAGFVGGLLGIPLAGYTGVLIANTAIPVWNATRRTLPPLFMASSLASAGSILQLLSSSERSRTTARRLTQLGQVSELALSAALHVEARRSGRPARALTRGLTGALLGAAAALTATSLVSSLLPGAPRRRRTSALLGAAGALALRFGLFHAGKASARDPRATFAPQRRRLDESA